MSTEEDLWHAGPLTPDLPFDRLDVWRIHLNPVSSESHEYQVLAPDEIARAERFHFEHHRLRYVNCRRSVRAILGRYLRVPPGDITFAYETNGKPEIVNGQNEQQLRFNVSHSSDLAILAVSCDRAVGADIEALRDQPDYLELAIRYFSDREYRDLAALSADRGQRAFFTCWTRKEAFVKACGVGLSYPLSEFSVSVRPDVGAAIEEIKLEPNAVSRWSLIDVQPGDGYVGAVALGNPPCSVTRWNWQC